MTIILGKDAPLEESIKRMRDGLKNLGFDIEEVRWLNPVPHVWSLHIRDKNCPTLFTQGKGSTPEAAQASALGEFYERLSTNDFFADYYLGSEIGASDFVHYPNERWFPATSSGWPLGVLDEHSRNHFDPQDEICGDQLVDLNSGNDERGVCCLPFIRQTDAETIWFPVNIIGNLYLSNGMAAGNTPLEARVQALTEIFERNIKNTIISTGISLPCIPAKVIARYPKTEAAIKALRVQGFYVDVRDASLGGKYPLVNVTLFNKSDGGCFASFGAHPKFKIALERAVTELLQGRALDALHGFPAPTFDLDQASDPHNLEVHFIDSRSSSSPSGMLAWDMFSDESDYPFTDWNIEGDTEAEYQELCRRIYESDMQIYIADYQHLGVYACRILVPGMSEVYPVDELVWRNNNAAAPLRSALLAADQLDKDEAAELLEDIELGGFDDPQPLAELLGIATDANTHWDRLSVGEIKMLLALRAGDLALAHDLCGWRANVGQLPADRLKQYRCLHQLLAIAVATDRELEAYRKVLTGLYGEPLLEHCLEMLKGRSLFDDLGTQDERLLNFKHHQSLLTIYKRLQTAKKNHTP